LPPFHLGAFLTNYLVMPQSHQTFRPVPTVKLLGIMFKNRCWPIILHINTVGDANERCQKRPVWSAPNIASSHIHIQIHFAIAILPHYTHIQARHPISQHTHTMRHFIYPVYQCVRKETLNPVLKSNGLSIVIYSIHSLLRCFLPCSWISLRRHIRESVAPFWPLSGISLSDKTIIPISGREGTKARTTCLYLESGPPRLRKCRYISLPSKSLNTFLDHFACRDWFHLHTT
jgi:hypothetical protein